MIGLFAVTAAGRRSAAELAARLGPDAVVADGPIGSAVRRLWDHLDAAVFFLASGSAVRLVAPLLRDERTDPGVVCVDDERRFAIALAGTQAGGADVLAEQVADVLDCQPVVTSATGGAGTTPLDELVEQLDATVDGDLVACGAAVLDGLPVRLVNPHGFPLPALPPNVSPDVERPLCTVVIDDRRPTAVEEHTLRLIPRTLVVGVGSARGISRTAVTETIARLDSEHGLDPRAIRAIASVDRKAEEGGILEAVQDLGFWHSADGGDELSLLTYPAEVLAAVEVPNPSPAVQAGAGTPSVAEASALHAAAELGFGAPVELVAAKIKGDGVTVAAARIRPRGRLALIGIGPGAADLRVPRADVELRRASVVVGLDQYVDQVRHLLRPGTEVRATGLGEEEARAVEAVELAREGRAVALIGSGDAGVHAMASPALEKADVDIEVVGVPGVTAVLAASALLGAPLGHDHALISLSGLRTPWAVIERRVRAAAEGDLVVCLYNPRSEQLARALEILAEHRPATTPVGAVQRATRTGQRVWCAPIGEFDPAEVDMSTTIVVGSSQSTVVGHRMVTPRGYRWMATDTP
ncbi:cobalt-precorrin 5A hydrolase / precorrin-3B C17-methyltransferase [Saccharopolyspora kobensis]|uniref:Cobalt-precorrin 5A hydrolase / precorrin-3B C17-methyltransferase n=1 Tax=Saccharopolyspora kobensis TaxID=146035 RepID=A0A1H6BUN9_9PSEU|nr:precorrin-3B C(17)-methyltransferase [Saccharopolyspora kobensis]SEG64165.1 cobalt-precorrin 5A hydrolase / precorrin-3B C17-methyltransferase [Saccharopolyspora kobensis]SFC16182.1 cobalt-precorrin 5A hydrolase / precorrin-3B C17-methyltransferase [Saccharopolyspora kobensis]